MLKETAGARGEKTKDRMRELAGCQDDWIRGESEC